MEQTLIDELKEENYHLKIKLQRNDEKLSGIEGTLREILTEYNYKIESSSNCYEI